MGDYTNYIIAFMVIFGVIKMIINVNNDYKDDQEKIRDEEERRREIEEVNRRFEERFGKYLHEDYQSTTYTNDPPSTTRRNDDDYDMIDLVEEHMAMHENDVHQERIREQLYNFERDTMYSMDEHSWQSDYFSNEMNDRMDDHNMNDRHENDIQFQDDIFNNDF